jgi:hypothetical protein
VIDPLAVVFLVVIAACVPTAAYLIPQDPALVKLAAAISQWRRHRHVRRWVDQQRRDRRWPSIPRD